MLQPDASGENCVGGSRSTARHDPRSGPGAERTRRRWSFAFLRAGEHKRKHNYGLMDVHVPRTAIKMFHNFISGRLKGSTDRPRPHLRNYLRAARISWTRTTRFRCPFVVLASDQSRIPGSNCVVSLSNHFLAGKNMTCFEWRCLLIPRA